MPLEPASASTDHPGTPRDKELAGGALQQNHATRLPLLSDIPSASQPCEPSPSGRSGAEVITNPDRASSMAVRELEHLPWGSRNRLGLASAHMSQAVMSRSSAPVAPVATVETLDVSCREPQAEDGPGVV
jgi:hypothetical protein